eukprot:CAMPEP_0177654588 /NCGR_PEP_ID=MMETSP0447-20121125/14423_1 /TAXON_ID=0 /ORGANISM="Stygamoeba regulata, Strain BSH-02190019" /LENGTH=198 /DNA_ID=CAMNT_0019158269 /DNA_START=54 /DNA_END=650 /DNA_ORIENTATION=-
MMTAVEEENMSLVIERPKPEDDNPQPVITIIPKIAVDSPIRVLQSGASVDEPPITRESRTIVKEAGDLVLSLTLHQRKYTFSYAEVRFWIQVTNPRRRKLKAIHVAVHTNKRANRSHFDFVPYSTLNAVYVTNECSLPVNARLEGQAELSFTPWTAIPKSALGPDIGLQVRNFLHVRFDFAGAPPTAIDMPLKYVSPY